MDFRRILANAFARRIAYVVVAAALAWLGLGKAHAQNGSHNDGDQGAAYAHCWADVQAAVAAANAANPRVEAQTYANTCSELKTTQGKLYGYYGRYLSRTSLGAGQYSALLVRSRQAHNFDDTTKCSHRASEYGWAIDGMGTRCHNGCTYEYAIGIGTPSGFHATGTVCKTTDAPSPIPDSDGDGVPDDLDAFPNDPNESKDSDADGIGDNADIAPTDETNGEDEGEGNETDNTATGGGDCNAPPTCKGDGIACNTNFQIWRLRCQGTAHGSVVGNIQDCNSPLSVVSPDPIANAQLAALRKIACEGGTGSGDGFGAGDSNNLGTIADAVRGTGTPDTGLGPEQAGDAWMGEGSEDPPSFDESGYGFSRSCPTIPPIDVFGTSIAINVEPLCDWATLGGYIVVALAGLACVRIISGRAA